MTQPDRAARKTPMTHRDLSKILMRNDSAIRNLNIVRSFPVVEQNIFDTMSDFFSEKYSNMKGYEISVDAREYDGAFFFPALTKNLQLPAGRCMEVLAYDSNISPIWNAQFFRNWFCGFRDHPALPVFPFKPVREMEILRGRYFYIGMMDSHFGHFILETLGRFWAPFDPKDFDGFLIHFDPGKNLNAHKSGSYAQYFRALGINPESIRVIDKPIFVESVCVPHTPCILPARESFIAPELKIACRKINNMMREKSSSPSKAPSRVYISRRSLNSSLANRKLLNEEEIENAFARRGFHIMFPETLPNEYDKHLLLSEAEVVAGVPGSGLLNSTFCRNGVHVIAIESAFPANMALSHQIQVSEVVGDKLDVFFSYSSRQNDPEWRVDISELDVFLDRVLGSA